MARLYGSLDNRLEENHNYTKRELRVGDDITMYYWSDRTCYYITKVVNQKNIFVHRYEVCADHSKPGGMGHQNWLYFKTIREERAYINDCIDKGLITGMSKENLDEIKEASDEEWVFRYNHWYQIFRITPKTWKHYVDNARKDCKPEAEESHIISLAQFYARINDKELEQIKLGKTVNKYYKIDQGISFGVRDYHYDWEY